MILPNCLEEGAREIDINRLTVEIGKRLEKVNVSVGITQTGPIDYADPDMLIRQANEQTYLVKKAVKSVNLPVLPVETID